jgi:hypothetical protein
MIERRMIEKLYSELQIGDCVWVAGALIQVEKQTPANKRVIYFYGKVLRAGGIHSEGDFACFSGLPHGAVLTEVLPIAASDHEVKS